MSESKVNSSPQIKPTLGLIGATMNAMALIAPGAFLWITYQLQAAAKAPNGASVASDIWLGIVLVLGICFLTAFSYAELAKIYPEAGFASVTYFAEKAFLESDLKLRDFCPLRVNLCLDDSGVQGPERFQCLQAWNSTGAGYYFQRGNAGRNNLFLFHR